MGKKGYNWKARQNATIAIDDSTTKKIAVDIQHRQDQYDNCNALVLPSAKRKTSNKDKRTNNVRLLTKKRRKQLEKVVERKNKKLKRASLLDDLVKVQAPADEIKQYDSLAMVQTKGLKRYFREIEKPEFVPKNRNEDDEDLQDDVVNSIRGSKKKRLSILESGTREEKSTDPNVVGLDESSEDETEASESENETSENETTNVEISKLPEKKDSIDEKTEKCVNITNNSTSETIATKSKPSPKITIDEKDRVPAVFVAVNRKPEIQEARLKLPVLAEEQCIVEAINENPVVIITGETGSGKTTQVPQFLFEAGYAKDRMIGVTEPRRVAAISMSKRVATEMNLTTKEVSYLIRFEGNASEETKIKFMTDGVLLKEIQTDFMLKKYSVIILDEAHERSVYTDILIGLLSRIVPLRAKKNDPLKLVIMSATLRVEDFINNSRLFKIRPPVIKIDTRQFPVTIHFNRRTCENYVLEAIKKAIKIHTRLPEGGILIFLTGQNEVNTVVRRLRKAFPWRREKWKSTIETKSDDVSENVEDSEDESNAEISLKRTKGRRKKTIDLPRIDLDEYSIIPEEETREDFFDADEIDDDEGILDYEDDDDDDDDILDLKNSSNSQPLWVLPLYSMLSSEKQARVFEPVPPNCRLCVVSTNVAETSLTIPNVKYVVDSGRWKKRIYDKTTGVSTYRVCYASKAAANQRAGRAGRTSPGHCYRLFSSAVFNDQFELFSEPEIRRKPVDDLLLQMKVMKIDRVVNFPFPTSPDIAQLQSAEKRLRILGALEKSVGRESYSSKITKLGCSIASFPVAPRYGKMLAVSQQRNLLRYTISMVAVLSVQEIMIDRPENGQRNKWLETRRYWAGNGNNLLLGDPMVLIRAVGGAEFANSKGNLEKFCDEHGLRTKGIREVRKLRQQLTNEIVVNIPSLNLTIDPIMAPPTEIEAKLLRQIILSGTCDQIAHKVSIDEITDQEEKIKWRNAYKTLEMEDPVFVHSSCVLRKSKPEWIVYQEIYETNKMYMRGVTAIEPEWLPKFVPDLCKMKTIVDGSKPRYDEITGKVMCSMSGTFGPQNWPLPIMEIEHPTDSDGVRYFAKFLLDGQIFTKLKRFVPSLLSTPSSVEAFWAKLLPRTETLVQTLLSRGVMSRDKLIEIWNDDKHFLLEAYKKWLPESAHSELTLIWPPL